MVVARFEERENGELLFNGYRVSVMVKKIWRLMMAGQYECT